MLILLAIEFIKQDVEKGYNARLVEHFIAFSHEFDKFNNTGARMLYSIISLLDATPCDSV